jgi:hypothetical protein
LVETRLSNEYGENTDVATLNVTDKEFKNHEETASNTLFRDKEEFRKLIRLTFGLLL